MKLIVAVSQNWGIGKDNSLLFNIPKDMKFFRDTTMGKRIVLGRKNLESFPGGKPLKNRENVLLTRNKSYKLEGVTVFNNIKDFLAYDKNSEDTYVIGGESIYRLLLPYCDTCYVTKVFEKVPCDKYMVNLDKSRNWKCTEQSEKIEDNGHIISFLKYERVN